MKLSATQLSELADYLRGTCHTVMEGLSACEFVGYDDCDAEARLSVDHEMAICETCGWWEETNDMTDGVCMACLDDEEKDRCPECGETMDSWECDCEDEEEFNDDEEDDEP